MREAGFDVAVAAAPGDDLDIVAEQEGVEVFPVPMCREISPLTDLRSIHSLQRVIRRWKPEIVNASTPKGGLLGMLAARISRVPVRIYTLRGLRLETATGGRRALLMRTERIAAKCSHRVLAVSSSLADRYVELGLAPREKVATPAAGSSNGVNAGRFANLDREQSRRDLKISFTAPVVGFVGRLTRDKGVVELVQAFERIYAEQPEARLLLVGDFESGDPVPIETIDRIRNHPAILQTGFVADVARCYAAMDVLAFPSHREGFPNVPLEAATAGIPVVGYWATGTVDAVVHGETGTLVEIGDVESLTAALAQYLAESKLRTAHGAAGCRRVEHDFEPVKVWHALRNEYLQLLDYYGIAHQIPEIEIPDAQHA